MEKYLIGQRLTEIKCVPEEKNVVLLLFSSGEMDKKLSIPGLEESLCHMPAIRDVHVCKAEVRRECLYGTLSKQRSSSFGGIGGSNGTDGRYGFERCIRQF